MGSMGTRVKLKIVSDGTAEGTKITDEHGNLVENIQAVKIEWELDVGGLGIRDYKKAEATIRCILTPCDISVVGVCLDPIPGILPVKPQEAE